MNIAIIGKYVELKDAYKSLDEALTHGGIANNIKVKLVRIDSEKLKASEIKEAYNQRYNKKFTDDASVFENFGGEIITFEGEEKNIKITTKIDLKIATILC